MPITETTPLTPLEHIFAETFVSGDSAGNIVGSYRYARGQFDLPPVADSTMTANAQRIFRKLNVAARIQELKDRRGADLGRGQIITLLGLILNSSVTDYEIVDGKLVVKSELDKAKIKAVQSFKLKRIERPDGSMETVVDLTLWNKVEVIRLSMQYLGMLERLSTSDFEKEPVRALARMLGLKQDAVQSMLDELGQGAPTVEN